MVDSSGSQGRAWQRPLIFSTALGLAVLLEFCLPYGIDASQPADRAWYAAIAVLVIPAACALFIRFTEASAKPHRLAVLAISIQASAIAALLAFVIGYHALIPGWPPIALIRAFWPILIAGAISGTVSLAASLCWTERLSSKQLHVILDVLLGLLLVAVVAAAFRVFFNSTSTALSSLDLSVLSFCTVVLLSCLGVALTVRFRATSAVGPFLGCLVAIGLSFPVAFKVNYYHAMPVVAPARQLVSSGAVLLLDCFSQYGAGPVLISAAAQMVGGPPFEATAFLIQILTSILLLMGCALVILPLQERRWTAAGVLFLILLASPMLLFGQPLYNFPSILLWRLLLPTIIALAIFILNERPRLLSIVCGAILGVSPFWSLDSLGLSIAIVLAHFLFLLVQGRPWKTIVAMLLGIATAASSIFSALTVLYLVSFGHLPRFGIQIEIISTYMQPGNWQWTDAPHTLFYIFPLIVTAGYALAFSLRAIDRFAPIAVRSREGTERPSNEQAWLALHFLATLTAFGTIYYIGRPAGWVLPGGTFFGGLFCVLAACLILERRTNIGLAFRIGAVATLTAIVVLSSAAISLILSPNGPGKKFQIVGSVLAHGALPQPQLKDMSVKEMSTAKRAPFAEAAAPYIAAGRPVEIITGNAFVSELMHVAYHLPYYLPVSAYLSDSLSPTRSHELMAASERLPDRLIIITNTPQNEMKLARTFTSVSRDIIRRLNSAGRLCKIQETDKVIVYEYGVCRGLLR